MDYKFITLKQLFETDEYTPILLREKFKDLEKTIFEKLMDEQEESGYYDGDPTVVLLDHPSETYESFIRLNIPSNMMFIFKNKPISEEKPRIIDHISLGDLRTIIDHLSFDVS